LAFHSFPGNIARFIKKMATLTLSDSEANLKEELSKLDLSMVGKRGAPEVVRRHAMRLPAMMSDDLDVHANRVGVVRGGVKCPHCSQIVPGKTYLRSRDDSSSPSKEHGGSDSAADERTDCDNSPSSLADNSSVADGGEEPAGSPFSAVENSEGMQSNQGVTFKLYNLYAGLFNVHFMWVA
jgi:hypothetical protein